MGPRGRVVVPGSSPPGQVRTPTSERSLNSETSTPSRHGLVLQPEVAGETVREVGIQSVRDQDGDLRGGGQFAEPGQDRPRAGRLVVDLEDVEELQTCVAGV